MTEKLPWAAAAEKVGRPLHLEYFHGSMYDAVVHAAAQLPDPAAHTAIYYLGERISLKEFLQTTDRCAEAMSACGVQAGDMITVALPNCPEALYAIYAANKLSVVANIVHPLTGEEDLLTALNKTQSRILFASGRTSALLLASGAGKSLKVITAEEGKEKNAKPRIRDFDSRMIKALRREKNVVSFDRFLAKAKASAQKHDGKDNDTAVILYSGGTTGTPKGIELTNLNLNAMAQNITTCNAEALQGEKPVITGILPIFHGFGLGVCIHAALFSNVGIMLIPAFSPKSFADALKEARPTVLAGVPGFYEELTRIRSAKNADLSFIKQAYCGGENTRPEVADAFDRLLSENGSDARLCEGYGMAETLAVATLNPSPLRKKGSVGIPIADTRVRIMDEEGEKELPSGEIGELWISGPSVMKGYYQNSEETQKALSKDETGEIWLCSGDLGYLDEDGYLFIADRKKRMFIVNGYNIYPSRIEQVLLACPGAADCAVFEETENGENRVAAAVVWSGTEKNENAARQALYEHCKKHLAAYEIPKRIEFRDSLPKTAIGKTAYQSLK